MLREVVLAAVLATDCGDDSSNEEAPSEKPAAEEEPSSGGLEPACHSVDLDNSTAGEKVNAAICLGLVQDSAFSCRFINADNVTECEGPEVYYYVEWDGVTSGRAYGGDGTYIAEISQASTGFYRLDGPDGELGECAVVGDVANLCLSG